MCVIALNLHLPSRVRPFICSWVRSFGRLVRRSLSRSLVRSLTHALTHSHVLSLSRSLPRSFCCSVHHLTKLKRVELIEKFKRAKSVAETGGATEQLKAAPSKRKFRNGCRPEMSHNKARGRPGRKAVSSQKPGLDSSRLDSTLPDSTSLLTVLSADFDRPAGGRKIHLS